MHTEDCGDSRWYLGSSPAGTEVWAGRTTFQDSAEEWRNGRLLSSKTGCHLDQTAFQEAVIEWPSEAVAWPQMTRNVWLLNQVLKQVASWRWRKWQPRSACLDPIFFQDMTGVRRDKGQKVYDHLTLAAEEWDESEADAYVGHDDVWDDEAIEALAAENDEDATLILQFEDTIADVVQSDHDLAAFFSTYQDARRRLNERVRVRGFWPVKKGFGKKGSWRGKGSSKGKGSSLAQRIANSHCRLCNQKGHWKAECPNKPSTTSGSSSATVISAHVIRHCGSSPLHRDRCPNDGSASHECNSIAWVSISTWMFCSSHG